MPIPITDAVKKQLAEKKSANFSLCFPRLVEWTERGDAVEVNEERNARMCNDAARVFPAADGCLKQIHKRQADFIASRDKQGLITITLRAKLTTPFITGLGSGHPSETGMILDRNTGLPYIPASSIKGVLRLAYALSIAKRGDTTVDDAELAEYFGNTKEMPSAMRGGVVFLDAYPETIPALQTDIMNPHFNSYYGKIKNLPLETDNPVPIKFLSVKAGTFFVFRCYFLPLLCKDGTVKHYAQTDKEKVEKSFCIAFSTLGFGGKTAVGYGRFELSSEKEMQAAVAKQKALAIEEIKKSFNVKDSCKVVLVSQNKKGNWKVQIEGTEVFGTILNSSAVPPERKQGDAVIVRITAKPANGWNFEYLPQGQL